MFLIKLPTPITGITPASFIVDSSVFAGQQVLIASGSNAQLYTTTLSASHNNRQVNTVFGNPNAVTSSKPILRFINKRPVVLGLVYAATFAPNPNYVLSGIQAVLAAHGENITLVYKDNSTSYVKNTQALNNSNNADIGQVCVSYGRGALPYSSDGARRQVVSNSTGLSGRFNDYTYYGHR